MGNYAKRLEKFRTYVYQHDRFDPPLRVNSVGVSRWWKGDSFYNKSKADFSMNIITMGDAVYKQYGTGTLQPGDAFLAHKGAEQLFECGPAGFLHKRVVMVQGPVFDSLLRSTGLIDLDFVRPGNPQKIINMVREMYKIIKYKDENFKIRLSTMAFEMFSELAKDVAPEYPAPVSEAINFMKRNLNKNLSLDDVCNEIKLSVRHCTRKFEQHVGCPPMQFFTQQRMTWAETLLKDTVMSVKEIAAIIGYDDPLYFSMRFRKHAGISPRHYRSGL